MLPYLMGELYLFENCSVIQQDYQGRVVVVVVVAVVVFRGLVLILVQFAVAFCAVQRGLDANKTMTLMFVKVE